jgi:diguanylate cyclase (GGDEF)-like protein
VRPRGVGHLALAVLPTALVMLALLLSLGSPALAPRGLSPAPWQLLGWVLLGAAAALHRPFEKRPPMQLGQQPGTLGLGALVIGPVMATQGASPAAFAAGLTLVLAELLRRLCLRWASSAEAPAPGLLAVGERAMLAIGASLAAGAAGGVLPGSDPLLVLAPAAVYGIVLWLAAALLEASRGGRAAFLALAPPVALDVVGLAAGLLLADVARGAGWPKVLPLLLLLVALVAEAARLALLGIRAESRAHHLERLHEANERILGETSGMGSIAQQILTECRNVLPVQWFQFESPGEGGGTHSWAAGPDGLLVEGRPRPPARPSMLPGVHRRAEWEVFEETLHQGGDGDEDAAALATLRLWCDPRKIEPGAERLFATLLPQMASSVHRARLDREAKLDPLTGVPVRRLLDARMQTVFRRANEEGKPMAVIMCDIDFFKKVNDTWGHTAGDEALKLVAKTLDRERRESDLCCRYGGEEFTVLLENTDGADALRLAERLRRAIAALAFVYDRNRIPLTLSLGVASFPELHIKTASELLLLADEALYEAKKRGRNQALLNLGRQAFRAPATGDASDIMDRP